MAEIVSHAQAVQTLKEWMAALDAASTGQSYSIGGRTLTRQDIPQIRAEIQRWHNTVNALEAEARGQSRPLGSTAAFPAPGSGGVPGRGVIYSQSIWERW